MMSFGRPAKIETSRWLMMLEKDELLVGELASRLFGLLKQGIQVLYPSRQKQNFGRVLYRILTEGLVVVRLMNDL